MKHISLLTLATLLAGCSTHATLTVESSPKGAMISQITAPESYRRAPYYAQYHAIALLDHMDANGCYKVVGFKAKWESGAEAQTPEILKLCDGVTDNYTYLISRPDSADGIDIDLAFEAKYEEAVRQQQIAYAQEQERKKLEEESRDRGNAVLINAFTNEVIQYQNMQNQYRVQQIERQRQQNVAPTRINCLSNTYGITEITNCSVR